MELGPCGKISKWILHSLLAVLLLAGLGTLTLGLWLRFGEGTKGIFEMTALDPGERHFVNGVTATFTLGSVFLGGALVGELLALSGNRRLLQLLAVLLALGAGSVAALAYLAYDQGDTIREQISEFYISAYSLYYAKTVPDPEVTLILALFHHTFHCCGLMGLSREKGMVNQTCPKPSGILDIVSACPAAITSAVMSRAPVVWGAFLGIGALLLVALVFTVIVILSIRTGGAQADPATDPAKV